VRFRLGGGGRRWLYAVVGTVILVLIAIAVTMPRDRANTGLIRLSGTPLGVNVAPWGYTYAANVSARGSLDVIQPLLKAASIRQLRYGAGSYADGYDWQTNSNIWNCLPGNPTASFMSKCASSNPLSFTQFSRQACRSGRMGR
jgi:hypothetical protein